VSNNRNNKETRRDGYASCNRTLTAQPQKLSTPDRIGLEKKLEILRRREGELSAEIPDYLDQREHPEKVQALKALKAQRKALEDQLLANQ